MIKDSFTLFRELLSNPTLGPTLEDFYNKALEKGLNKDEALKEAKLAYDCYNKFVKNNRIQLIIIYSKRGNYLKQMHPLMKKTIRAKLKNYQKMEIMKSDSAIESAFP